MRNRQIPRSERFQFLEDFSRRYDGWLVTVRVLHPSFGAQVEARDLALEGVVGRADATGPISIHLGNSPERHVEHEVEKPSQMWVELGDSGVERALAIESEDGTKTIVEFRAPSLPETVDGILAP